MCPSSFSPNTIAKSVGHLYRPLTVASLLAFFNSSSTACTVIRSSLILMNEIFNVYKNHGWNFWYEPRILDSWLFLERNVWKNNLIWAAQWTQNSRHRLNYLLKCTKSMPENASNKENSFKNQENFGSIPTDRQRLRENLTVPHIRCGRFHTGSRTLCTFDFGTIWIILSQIYEDLIF